MGRLVSKLIVAVISLITLYGSPPAFADVSTVLEYTCNNYLGDGSVADCVGPAPGATRTASTTTSSPISIGNAVGGVSGQADYSGLSGTVTGGWLSSGQITSGGYSTVRATDTITLRGGTGNVEVMLLMDVQGTVKAPDLNTSGVAVGGAAITLGGDSVVQAVMYNGVGNANLYLVANGSFYSAEWISDNGRFSASGNFNVPIAYPAGTLVSKIVLSYDTPYSIETRLQLNAAASGEIAQTGRLTLRLPPGTRVESASGLDYAASQDADVPMPGWALGALAMLLSASAGFLANRPAKASH